MPTLFLAFAANNAMPNGTIEAGRGKLDWYTRFTLLF